MKPEARCLLLMALSVIRCSAPFWSIGGDGEADIGGDWRRMRRSLIAEGLDDQGTDRAVSQRLAPKTVNPSPLARCSLCSQTPKVGGLSRPRRVRIGHTPEPSAPGGDFGRSNRRLPLYGASPADTGAVPTSAGQVRCMATNGSCLPTVSTTVRLGTARIRIH